MTTSNKNQTAKNVTTNKNVTPKKEIVKKTDSEIIENIETEILETKELDSNLLNINLDTLNFDLILNDKKIMSTVSNNAEKLKKTASKFELYTFKTTKSDRQKIRTNLKKYCNNINLVLNSKDTEKIKSFISDFLKFYKENYKLNDFTLNSLVYPNADDDTKLNVTSFLELFKKLIS